MTVSTSRTPASRKTMADDGSFTSRGSSRPAGCMSRERSTIDSSRVLPSIGHGQLGAQAHTRPAQLGLDVAVAGIELRGQLHLDQRFLELARRVQPAAAREMQLRGAQLCAFQGQARVEVVGVLLERLGVLDDGPVVVVGTLGGLRPSRIALLVAQPAASAVATSSNAAGRSDASGDEVSGPHR